MSDFGSGSPDDPFGDNPAFKGLFGDIMKMMGKQGPMNWDGARQFALHIATNGEPEPNVDPVARMQLEQLARVAELQVANATGLDASPGGRGLTIVPVTRGAWALKTLDAYHPLFEALSSSIGSTSGLALEADDESLGFLSEIMKMMGPMMLGLSAGSMVGHLAQRSFGQYELPIPRPVDDGLMIVVPNLESFGEEWSLPPDDLRLWVLIHEVTHHAILGVPHVRERLDQLLHEYLAAFESDPERIADGFGGGEMFDLGDPASFGKMLEDPSVMLGAVQSDRQRELLPQLEALVCAIAGYVDSTMDEVGSGLLSNYGMVTEAVRRRRVEAGDADRFVEQLFGLELTQAAYDRGRAFADGVIERGGREALGRLWSSARELPTPAEIDAPGLWLARIDLPE